MKQLALSSVLQAPLGKQGNLIMSCHSEPRTYQNESNLRVIIKLVNTENIKTSKHQKQRSQTEHNLLTISPQGFKLSFISAAIKYLKSHH